MMVAAAPQLVTLDQALASTRAESVRRYARYINPDLAKLFELVGFDRRFVSAQGLHRGRRREGRRVRRFSRRLRRPRLGPQPSLRWIAAVQLADQLPNILQIAVGPLTVALAQTLSAVAPPDELRQDLLLQQRGRGRRGAGSSWRAPRPVASGFLYCEGSIHGKSFRALSVCGGGASIRSRSSRCWQGCRSVPFGDADALGATSSPAARVRRVHRGAGAGRGGHHRARRRLPGRGVRGECSRGGGAADRR